MVQPIDCFCEKKFLCPQIKTVIFFHRKFQRKAAKEKSEKIVPIQNPNSFIIFLLERVAKMQKWGF